MRRPCTPSYTLKRLEKPLAFLCNGQRRSLHAISERYTVGVIGGGIAGLTAAYRLSRDPKCSKVTIYEKGPRMGGWIQSEKISVDGGDIVFEYGPRTLRVSTITAFPLLDLLTELGLEDEMLITKTSSTASQNRYIYYPDRLVRMPGPQKGVSRIYQLIMTLKSLLQEPVFESVLLSLLREPFIKRPVNIPSDESVMDFVSRRWSPKVADNLASSVFQGIYAGNIDRLSAETLLGPLRAHELSGSVAKGITEMKGKQYWVWDDFIAMLVINEAKKVSHLEYLRSLAKDSSTLTFKNGVGQLADALVAELKRSPKVEVLTRANVTSILQDHGSSNLTVKVENDRSRVHNRLIATNSPSDLARQLQSSLEPLKQPTRTINALQRHNYATTTMVVNLYYPNPNLVPVRGFGYLIPRTIPFAQNPERALGVIFASESSVGQDTAPGTKLTVMMGGHYWDEWKESDYPDHDTAVLMAQSLLKRHLGITDSPTVARTRLQRDAIPQPTVGHLERMQDISTSIKSELDNRVTLAGAWYSMHGTGVVDSIRQAYLAAKYGPELERSEAPYPSAFPMDSLGGGGIISHYQPRWIKASFEDLFRKYGIEKKPS
ncbi:hypothetical protein BDW71DRAFT_120824 [Aspergillus fruticulosus]